MKSNLKAQTLEIPVMKSLELPSFVLQLLSMIVAMTLPIHPMMIAVLVLVLADAISGISASKKEKKKITSSGFRRTIVKLFAYEAAILFAFVLETYLVQDIPMVKVIGGLIGITEAKSFFENLHRITGIDLYKEVLSRLNMKDVKNSDEK